mgnify:CR=1 FL=1
MPIRPRSTVPAAAALALLLAAAPAAALDPSMMSCGQLWQSRHALLKARGVCFTDPRAVRTFGNDGCTVADPARAPLSADERQRMARIVLAEKMKLCR